MAAGPCRHLPRGFDRPGVEVRARERGTHQRDVARPDARGERHRRAAGAVLEQVARDVVVAASEGHADGGRAVERVLRVDVGAALDEQADDLEAPLVGREDQRRHAVARPDVHVHAGLEQGGDLCTVPVTGGVPQGLGLGRGFLCRDGGGGKERAEENRERHVA